MDSYESILSRMEESYAQAAGHRAEDVSDTGLRLRVLAAELYRLQAELAWLKRQAFPQTAAGEWLDRHGETRGVEREAAARAAGTLRFSRYLPLSFDVVIPAGTVCATSGEDPVEVETTADVTLSAGSLTVDAPARAVLPGQAGNCAAGTVNTMPDPPAGMNYVTNPEPFTGGAPAETDEPYRARVLAAYAALPNGTNAAYYRETALAVPGVGAVQVVPRIDGANTVGLYLWGKGGPADAALVETVRARLQALREIGVTVRVAAATTATVNVNMLMGLPAGMEQAAAQTAVREALEAYFAELAPGGPVYLAALQRVILNAVPAVSLQFPVTARDLKGSEGVRPVLGTVTVEVSA